CGKARFKSIDKLLDIEVRILEDKNIKTTDDLMGFEGRASDIYFTLSLQRLRKPIRDFKCREINIS
ncbi:MAG: CRISPR-associated endonuclease Cas1, partial [Candidatus Methanoperedenaceae archaeon]|nr:CRISPR-associated endonuclease Cas1 [Candidatus Methanoperedenaceae archaeon]